MPNINLTSSSDGDLGNRYITKEYLMTVYPQIADQLITPELWGWGRNDNAQIGNDTTTDRSTPVTTRAGGANWKQVSCGYSHTAAIKTDRTLWVWGRNFNGNLGDNTATQRRTPVTTFAGGTNWKQVAGGGSNTAAIKTDGTLWVWGNNTEGQLGDNTITQRSIPVTTFAGGTDWKQVSCGQDHIVAIKTDGTLWTWGDNTYGTLGNNTATQRRTPVTTFAGGTNWKQVSGGEKYTAAIKTDGTLWTWGRNSNLPIAALGDNTIIDRSTPVTTFAGGTNWKQVACGGLQTAAIKTDGTLWTWGRNSYGALGDNTIISRSTPVTTFAGGTNWKQVSCGRLYVSAIKTDGTLWIWGRNSYGQLGDSTIVNRSTPVTTFAGGTNWKQVTCGGSLRTAAIKTSDDLQGI